MKRPCRSTRAQVEAAVAFERDALAVVASLEAVVGQERMEVARDLVEHNEGHIGLNVAAWVIVGEGLTVSPHLVAEIRRLLEGCSEELEDLPEDLDAHVAE